MAKKKQKYYVVWTGRKKGVFSSWEDCKKQIDGFEGAQYKAFFDKTEAQLAYNKNFHAYKGKNTKKKTLTTTEKATFGKPILESISVDAACSGNPGKMEYRGVLTHNKQQIFIKGPYAKGTNNIGEFLALVHGLAELKKIKSNKPIYTDSITAISWVRKKKCNTKLERTNENENLFLLIDRAILWLKSNTYQTEILKWETKIWGEIPADFGRK